MVRYTRIIQESQHELGLPISSFDNLGMSAADFGKLYKRMIIFKNKKHQMKIIKLTDTNKKD
jgi:hypothetical protein